MNWNNINHPNSVIKTIGLLVKEKDEDDYEAGKDEQTEYESQTEYDDNENSDGRSDE